VLSAPVHVPSSPVHGDDGAHHEIGTDRLERGMPEEILYGETVIE
jgi:hypothetical protein